MNKKAFRCLLVSVYGHNCEVAEEVALPAKIASHNVAQTDLS